MTTIRRLLTVVLLTVAVIAGASIPASAAFADSVTVPTTVNTITVAAPSTLAISGNCQGWWYQLDLAWPASTTPRGVTGYRVVAYLNNGTTYLLAETDSATRSLSMKIDQSNLSLQPRIAVTTLTSYGWTAETPRSAALSC
jgi:hypothetical protein